MTLAPLWRPAVAGVARFVCRAACIAFAAFSVLAAPVPDPSFGDAGRVRLGVPTGFEDTVYASTIQADGKVVVAGTSFGRKSYAFVTRFTTAGLPDPSF